MQILKNLWNSVKSSLNKKKAEESKPVMKVVATSTKQEVSGLPVTFIPQEESQAKEIVGMSPVSITETPGSANELSPAESASEVKKKKPYKKYYKKKSKNAQGNASKPKPSGNKPKNNNNNKPV